MGVLTATGYLLQAEAQEEERGGELRDSVLDPIVYRETRSGRSMKSPHEMV